MPSTTSILDKEDQDVQMPLDSSRDKVEHGQADADQALNFLSAVDVNASEVLAVNLDRLRRRIDWRLIPFLWLCYTMCWLDKSIINYANVMGLQKNLHMHGNEYSDANTFFYLATTITEFPTGFILNKVSAKKWLSINVILWGISTACVGAAKDYHSLLATRILVGIFEAAVAPCLLLLVSQYYTKSEQSLRFCFWYAGLGTGQIIGGLESFGFQHVTNSHFQSWRIMFVTMGAVTILIGFCVFFFVAESPLEVKYLSTVEKTALLNHVSVNRTGVVNRHFRPKQVVELLLDVQIWWLCAMTISVAITSGVISSYSAVLLTGFGYTPKNAALLNSVSGVISIFSALASGYGARRFGHRWLWIVACALPSIIGAALMSFLTKEHKSGILAGIYLVNTCTATLPHIYQWTAANIAGPTKRPLAMGMVTAAFGIASMIGPQTFQAKDAPLYQPARITVLVTLSFAALLAAGLAMYYTMENKRRDRVQKSNGVGTVDEKWGNLTDRENLAFRYVI